MFTALATAALNAIELVSITVSTSLPYDSGMKAWSRPELVTDILCFSKY